MRGIGIPISQASTPFNGGSLSLWVPVRARFTYQLPFHSNRHISRDKLRHRYCCNNRGEGEQKGKRCGHLLLSCLILLTANAALSLWFPFG